MGIKQGCGSVSDFGVTYFNGWGPLAQLADRLFLCKYLKLAQAMVLVPFIVCFVWFCHTPRCWMRYKLGSSDLVP